jgi:hypothetical protein
VGEASMNVISSSASKCAVAIGGSIVAMFPRIAGTIITSLIKGFRFPLERGGCRELRKFHVCHVEYRYLCQFYPRG